MVRYVKIGMKLRLLGIVGMMMKIGNGEREVEAKRKSNANAQRMRPRRGAGDAFDFSAGLLFPAAALHIEHPHYPE